MRNFLIRFALAKLIRFWVRMISDRFGLTKVMNPSSLFHHSEKGYNMQASYRYDDSVGNAGRLLVTWRCTPCDDGRWGTSDSFEENRFWSWYRPINFTRIFKPQTTYFRMFARTFESMLCRGSNIRVKVLGRHPVHSQRNLVVFSIRVRLESNRTEISSNRTHLWITPFWNRIYWLEVEKSYIYSEYRVLSIFFCGVRGVSCVCAGN